MTYESEYDAVLDTREKAVRYIVGAIETSADPSDYDVEAIADELYDRGGDWDITPMPTADFWEAVERHAKV